MRFSNFAQALAAFSLTQLAIGDVINNVVMETVQVQVTVTVDPNQRQYDWRGHQQQTQAASTTVQTFTTTSTTSDVYTPPPPASSTTAPATASASSTTPSMDNSFADAILNSTNFYRSQYEAAPVTWNQTLADFAQSAASPCYFKHSGGPYGENIAAAWPTLSTIDGVDMWGNEESTYNWAAATFSEDTGHFTQLVWQSTTEVGCAMVSCQNSDTNNGGIDNGDFLVCEYSPAGNVMGSFAQNVRKAGLSKRGVPGLGERSASAAGKSAGLSLGMAALVVGCFIRAVAA